MLLGCLAIITLGITMADTTTPDAPAPPTFIRDNGQTIAYRSIPGKPPGVVFLCGFRSDMTGSKALWVEESCRREGRAFLRFDYTGHGESSGAFVEGTIGQWADDAVAAIERLTEGPQVLVGSSMGGWIMLLAALRLGRRVAGLLGIAAAPDFTEDLVPGALDAAQKAALDRDGVVYVTGDDDTEPTPITRKLLEDGRNHLLLGGEIPLDCPVRLIHGMKDADVPWERALRLSDRLRAIDVEVTLVKDGQHRLSEPADLSRLTGTLAALVERIGNPPRISP